jgi:hypothetical protein
LGDALDFGLAGLCEFREFERKAARDEIAAAGSNEKREVSGRNV